MTDKHLGGRLRIAASGRWCGMWRVSNIAVVMVLLAGIVVGPVTGTRPAYADADEDLDAPLLDRAHARQGHRLVERWVEQGGVPESPETPVTVTGLSGVRVTLWRDGVTYGSGEAYPPDLAAVTDDPGPATDLGPLLAEATRQALAGVQETLTEAELRARTDGLDLEGADRPGNVLAIAGQLLVSVQVARPLERIRLHGEAPINELYANFAPGAHGLRVTAADDARRVAVLWPATALERNMSPRGQLTHLLSSTGHDPTAIGDLARSSGPQLARFETLHVVRPRHGWQVEDLVRGSVLLPQQQVDEATLDSLADRLGRHLERRFTGEGLVRGTYMPTSNRFDPVVAEPAEAALAAYALTRHAGQLHAVGDESRAEAKLDRAGVAVQRLGDWVLAGADGAEPSAALAAASLTLLSLVDMPGRTGEQREMRDNLGRWLVEQVSGEVELATVDAEADADAPADGEPGERAAAQALTVAALAALYQQQRDGDLAAVVAELMHEQSQAQPDVASLWWRALAHERADELLPDGPAAAQRSEAVRTLARLGQTFQRRQVRRAPELGPADVVGGFELSRVARDAPPNPDWRTSHVLAFQAVALRTPGMLEGGETIDWLLSAGLAARFLAQLVVDEPAAYALRSPADALGGVRLAPWNNHLTVSAQAMTLLAILELQTSLERLAERGM